MEHLDDYKLGLFVTGKLTENEEDLIELHLSECAECRARFDRAEQLRFQVDPFIHEIKLAANVIPIKKLTADRLLGNNFLLKNKIGQGGMGVVWEAYDRLGNRQVVLKFILPNSFCFDEATRTYRETFQKIHMLHHSNICPLYGLYEDSEYGLYLAMKYIDGETLSAYRKRKGVLPVDEVVEILRYVAAGLDYSHTHKVVHNDIKPQNIMISKTDGIQIIDFDLADAIHDSISSQIKMAEKRIAGTRVYMAPEQWMGTTCLQSDQYALAVTAYELLSGHVPFEGKDIDVLSLAVRKYLPPTIKELPDHVNAVLQRGLAKDPEKRFSSCIDFVSAFNDRSIQVQIETDIPNVEADSLDFPARSVSESAEKPKNTNRILPWAILITVAVVGFLLAWLIFIEFNFYPESKKKSQSDPPAPNRHVTEQNENKSARGNSPKNSYTPPIQSFPANKLTTNTEKRNGPQITLPQRETSFPSIRFLVNIDEKGIVTFHAQRSNTIEPFPVIEGTSFPFSALQVGMAICGPEPSNNRVIFPLGQISPPSSSMQSQFSQPFSSFGWKFQSCGQSQSSSSFSRYREISGIVYTKPGIVSNSSEIVSNSSEIVPPGMTISKKIKLPVTFAYEIIDDVSPYPPVLCISIHQESKSTASNIRFSGIRDQDGLLIFSGSIDGMPYNSTNAGTTTFENVKLDKDGSFTEHLIIPSNALYQNGFQRNEADHYMETAFTLQVYPRTKRNGQFELSYLEIAGDIEGNIGVPSHEHGVDLLIVQNIHKALINTIPHSKGTTITGINGTSNPAEIKKILNSLKFGEKITLDITENKGSSSSNTEKRKVTLFAQ